MKLAIVHDWIKGLSGAERVLRELHLMYPDAPIYTLFYDRKFVRQFLPKAEVRASFLQRVPFITTFYSALSWLMPSAVESFDLSQFDTVISSSAIFSKGLVLRPSTRHICYCYSPTRQIWDLKGYSGFAKHILRLWDRAAAERPTEFVAISQTVADRIKKYYRRDAQVIYPPAPSHADTHKKSTEYYLIVSRLYDYKNVDVAVEAFNKLGYPLVIIGDGPSRGKLQRIAHKNITFAGQVDDETVAEYYASCRAFIMPQEEDFGLTAVEAMTYGKPVVALRKGGAIETVVDGITGEFFDDPIPEALADAVRRLNENYMRYDQKVIKEQSSRFSLENFKNKINQLLHE